MSEMTANLGLPLLHVGQSAKELTHNEALTLIDALLLGQAQDILSDPSAISEPMAGQLWIVATGGTGDWAAREDHMALWTDGGWRFVPPCPGFRIYLESQQCLATYDGSWQLVHQISAPATSSTQDDGARATLAALMGALAAQGLIRQEEAPVTQQ